MYVTQLQMHLHTCILISSKCLTLIQYMNKTTTSVDVQNWLTLHFIRKTAWAIYACFQATLHSQTPTHINCIEHRDKWFSAQSSHVVTYVLCLPSPNKLPFLFLFLVCCYREHLQTRGEAMAETIQSQRPHIPSQEVQQSKSWPSYALFMCLSKILLWTYVYRTNIVAIF